MIKKFQRLHIYIEHYLHPTPKRLTRKARDCLRGAYFREEIEHDIVIAEAYLKRAIELAIDQGLAIDDPVIIDIWLRIAYNHVWANKFDEAITVYRSVFEMLLSKFGNKNNENNNKNYKDERLENLKKAIYVAKKLSDLYIRVQEYDIAEKYISWRILRLQALLQGNNDIPEEEYNISEEYPTEELNITSTIFENTKMINKEYIASIIMSHLGEVFYGLGKQNEALGWMQQGLNITKNGSGIKNCEECAGVILNNLGIIYEREDKKDIAISLFNQAIEYAEKAHDIKGIEDYTNNLNKFNLEHIDKK
ncbi:4586_t:CDS:2 [Diversispora eburnea]|uniref:4586_t:CDS:1 n=1 Tax=Diversispora eburnea TaxID=1213867 RepID=A0A9N8ZS70_9GLOM|nr:4586_t:CDS:2 [Diversispora eburnea]